MRRLLVIAALSAATSITLSRDNDILRALDAIGKNHRRDAEFIDNVILVLRVNLFTPF
ncbi:hypothetical protein JHU04_000317 [Brenneria sp. 4F2]|nr:hypothetical protein [Brenneria bubanii]